MVVLGYWLYCWKQALIGAEDLWPLAHTLSDRECVPLQSGNPSQRGVCWRITVTDRLIGVLWTVSHPGCNWRPF